MTKTKMLFVHDPESIPAIVKNCLKTEVSADDFKKARVRNWWIKPMLIPGNKRLEPRRALVYRAGSHVDGFVVNLDPEDIDRWGLWETPFKLQEIASDLFAFVLEEKK